MFTPVIIETYFQGIYDASDGIEYTSGKQQGECSRAKCCPDGFDLK